MAQTISTQKFAISMSFNNTLTTMFTLSSGTASRVIMNAFNFYRTDSAGGIPYFTFSIANATTGPMVIGAARSPSSANISAFALLPGNMTGPVGIFNSGSTVTTTGNYIFANNTQNNSPLGDQNPSACLFENISTQSSGSYFPAQFWMSAGDSFKVSGVSWGSGVVQGNFTVITES